jgi:hypothetical protein
MRTLEARGRRCGQALVRGAPLRRPRPRICRFGEERARESKPLPFDRHDPHFRSRVQTIRTAGRLLHEEHGRLECRRREERRVARRLGQRAHALLERRTDLRREVQRLVVVRVGQRRGDLEGESGLPPHARCRRSSFGRTSRMRRRFVSRRSSSAGERGGTRRPTAQRAVEAERRRLGGPAPPREQHLHGQAVEAPDDEREDGSARAVEPLHVVDRD